MTNQIDKDIEKKFKELEKVVGKDILVDFDLDLNLIRVKKKGDVFEW